MQVCLRFWMLLHWDFMFNASVLVGFDIGYFFQVFELGGFLVCLHCGFIGLLKVLACTLALCIFLDEGDED
ncbi:hypothetical protein HanPSC8_Chr16g0709271 [Helianthus annuus]|nr:hypothetical protein HanPSC8_Chr16g0709271 [Helianthus annuus]